MVMSGRSAERSVGLMAALLVTLLFATPLLCAIHSLHVGGAEASGAMEVASPADEDGSHGHHGDSEELCQAGAALVVPAARLKMRVTSSSLRYSECFCVSRIPEVPKPVPIPASTFPA